MAGQHFKNRSAFEEGGEIKARQLPRPSSSIAFIASLRFIRSPRPWDFAARGSGGWARRPSDRAASAREEGRRRRDAAGWRWSRQQPSLAPPDAVGGECRRHPDFVPVLHPEKRHLATTLRGNEKSGPTSTGRASPSLRPVATNGVQQQQHCARARVVVPFLSELWFRG